MVATHPPKNHRILMELLELKKIGIDSTIILNKTLLPINNCHSCLTYLLLIGQQ